MIYRRKYKEKKVSMIIHLNLTQYNILNEMAKKYNVRPQDLSSSIINKAVEKYAKAYNEQVEWAGKLR